MRAKRARRPPSVEIYFKEVQVRGNVGLVLVRNVVFGEDSVYRALRLARAAVDALVRVDIKLLGRRETGLVLSRVDTVDRANVNAG